MKEKTDKAGSHAGLYRVLDAAANRAGEGLRVMDDFARFVLDDLHLTARCKSLRHELTAALGDIAWPTRLAARSTPHDVGAQLTADGEKSRSNLAAVLSASAVRAQQSLRSLEEYSKIISADIAARFESLRYQSYTLAAALEITQNSIQRLESVRLYVIVDGRSSLAEFKTLIGDLVAGGAGAIQLRDKQLDDRTLLDRAGQLRELTRCTSTLFIMNDRPDLAVLARADGVHVGQKELAVREVRAIVGASAVIGVSTHNIEQARQAVMDGANYIGVGPTFSSKTKQFDEFAGTELLSQVADNVSLPAFAIGGICADNLPDVLATGMVRIAVSSAVTNAESPRTAVEQFIGTMEAERNEPDDASLYSAK